MAITTTDNDIKERLSVAYVTAVAARAGCQFSPTAVDRNRIDGTISPISGARVKIDVQLKATSGEVLRETEVAFDLDVATFDALRSTQIQSAQILVVLVLPGDPAEWLSISEDSLALKRCAYWRTLFGEEEARNTRSVQVRVPRSQIFSPEALREMVERADRNARAGRPAHSDD